MQSIYILFEKKSLSYIGRLFILALSLMIIGSANKNVFLYAICSIVILTICLQAKNDIENYLEVLLIAILIAASFSISIFKIILFLVCKKVLKTKYDKISTLLDVLIGSILLHEIVSKTNCDYRIIIFLYSFWGIGFFVFSGLFFSIFKSKYILISSIFAIISLVTSTNFGNNLYYVYSNENEKQNETKLARLISSNTQVIDYEFINKTPEKSKIIIPFYSIHKSAKEIKNKNIKNRVFFVFGEHDNLLDVANDMPFFNQDAYYRKGPWEIYHPLMTSSLQVSHLLDGIYSSNIGATLKYEYIKNIFLWDYDAYGRLIILSGKYEYLGNEYIVFGDSDVIANFLFPYNIFFGQSIFFDNFYIISFILFTYIQILFYFIFKKEYFKYICYTYLIFTIFILATSKHANNEADCVIKYTGSILCPHYDHHYSSLSSNLAKEGYSISHHMKSKSVPKVVIINQYMNINEPQKNLKLIILLPGVRIKFCNIHISASDCPNGSIFINDKNEIVDSRLVNGENFISINGTLIIGSGSPQKNVNVIKHIIHDCKN